MSGVCLIGLIRIPIFASRMATPNISTRRHWPKVFSHVMSGTILFICSKSSIWVSLKLCLNSLSQTMAKRLKEQTEAVYEMATFGRGFGIFRGFYLKSSTKHWICAVAHMFRDSNSSIACHDSVSELWRCWQRFFFVLYEPLTLRHGAYVHCTMSDLWHLFRVRLRLRRRARCRARDRVQPFFHGHYRLAKRWLFSLVCCVSRRLLFDDRDLQSSRCRTSSSEDSLSLPPQGGVSSWYRREIVLHCLYLRWRHVPAKFHQWAASGSKTLLSSIM